MQNHLAFVRLPLGTHGGVKQPMAGEVAAGGRSVRIDAAPHATREVGTPDILRLSQFRDHHGFAAERTVATLLAGSRHHTTPNGPTAISPPRRRPTPSR